MRPAKWCHAFSPCSIHSSRQINTRSVRAIPKIGRNATEGNEVLLSPLRPCTHRRHRPNYRPTSFAPSKQNLISTSDAIPTDLGIALATLPDRARDSIAYRSPTLPPRSIHRQMDSLNSYATSSRGRRFRLRLPRSNAGRSSAFKRLTDRLCKGSFSLS